MIDELRQIIAAMIGTIAVINLIAIILQGNKRTAVDEKSKINKIITLGILGGLFGMYATIDGYELASGAIVSVRDVGPMMAGCLGGPISGLIAGSIAGIHRLIFGRPNLFIGTTIPCAISTILIGLICGLLFKPFEKKKRKGIFAFIIAIFMEILHLWLVYIYTTIIKDVASAWNLVIDIAPSFLLTNAMAFGLMIFTTDMIDRYKLAEKKEEKIENELNTATNIQMAMIPDEFPSKKEFEIYASMTPAKQVGGDFYDFYFIDEDHFAFVIGDVSGKGVPAALFMAIAKTVIKNSLKLGVSFDEAIEQANNQLAEGNKEEMFVTAWIGIVQISTGKLKYINAGHNAPILKKSNGEILKLKERSGFIIAGNLNSKYKEFEIQLNKGDIVFVYTDGVTEANNKLNEFYGEERLISLLEKNESRSLKEICNSVKETINEFSKQTEQFDDITMMAFKYKGNDEKEIIVDSRIENIEKVIKFVEEKIEKYNCSNKTKSEINITIDELVGNIIKYAYNGKIGDITIRANIDDTKKNLSVIFIDSGIKYNPLENPKPDTTLTAEERKEGGLGILVATNLMDDINYEYKDGKNILEIIKKLN